MNHFCASILVLIFSCKSHRHYFSMKSTRDKEEYRRAYAVKQKMEGMPYRTIAEDIGVNYRNVYDWINNYRKFGLEGIRNRRKSGGRRAIISTAKNKEMIKDIVLNKSPRTFGYLKNTCMPNAATSLLQIFQTCFSLLHIHSWTNH